MRGQKADHPEDRLMHTMSSNDRTASDSNIPSTHLCLFPSEIVRVAGVLGDVKHVDS